MVELVQQIQAGRGTVTKSDCQCAIQRDDWRRLQLQERVVTRNDCRPVGCGRHRSGDVDGGNLGLQEVRSRLISCRACGVQGREAGGDHVLVPAATVLLFHRDQVALAVGSRRPAGMLQAATGHGDRALRPRAEEAE